MKCIGIVIFKYFSIVKPILQMKALREAIWVNKTKTVKTDIMERCSI